MILILCLSNLHVPISLSLINKHRNEDVLLFTDQQNIYSVFKQLNINNVYVYLRKSGYYKSNRFDYILKYLTGFRKQKRILLNDMKKYEFTVAYFFHNCFGTPELWLLQHIKIGKIYFAPTIKIEGKKCNNLISLITTLSERLFWGVERDAIRYGNIRYKVGNKFLSRNNIETINHNINVPEEYTQRIVESLNIKQKTILLIEDIFSTKNINQDIYFDTIKNIIEAIGKENIILKHHPRAKWDLKKYIKSDFIEMPSFIPVNIVIDKFDTIIGNYSSTIFEVIEKGKKGISLLYLFKDNYISQEMFETHIKYLKDNDSSGNLKFPTSISEVINI